MHDSAQFPGLAKHVQVWRNTYTLAKYVRAQTANMNVNHQSCTPTAKPRHLISEVRVADERTKTAARATMDMCHAILRSPRNGC